jgi:hypothetical protein
MDADERDRPKWAKDERADDDLAMIPEDGQAQNAPTGPNPVTADPDRTNERGEAENEQHA